MYRSLVLFAATVVFGVLAVLQLTPADPPADFRIAEAAECRSLDPHLMQWMQEFRIGHALFEGLTTPNPKTCAPEPGVAERWDLSPDGLVYTFHLRPHAKWSNAQPLTAHHFVHAWERGLNPRIASDYSDMLFVLRNGRRYYESVAAHDADGAAPVLRHADSRSIHPGRRREPGRSRGAPPFGASRE